MVQQQESTTYNMHAMEQQDKRCVLLQTAVAWIEGESSGNYARLLLDSGSQRSFIAAELAEAIGAKVIKQEKLTIGSFGGNETVKIMDVVHVKIGPQIKSLDTAIEALKVDVISRNFLPGPTKKISEKTKKLHFKIADETNREKKLEFDRFANWI